MKLRIVCSSLLIAVFGLGEMLAQDASVPSNPLGLTVEQKAHIKILSDAVAKQNETILKDPTLSQETKQKQLSIVRASYQQDFAKILTPEQLAKYKEKTESTK